MTEKVFDLLWQAPVLQSKVSGRKVFQMDPDSEKDRFARWYAIPENREKCVERTKKRLKENRDEINRQRRIRYKRSRAKILKQQRLKYARSAKVRADTKARSQKHYQDNLEEIKTKRKQQRKETYVPRSYMDTVTCKLTGESYQHKRSIKVIGKKVQTMCKICNTHHRLVAGPKP